MPDIRKQQTLLLVDDNAENIDVLSNILNSDYRLKAALSGQKALNIASAAPRPDLILLDIIMPDMNGYEVLKKLKSTPETARIPVIFITALSDHEDESKGLEMGAVDYITKPVNASIVKARVKTHLELKNYSDHLEQKVKDEVERHKDKNELLVQQSKMAAIGEIVDDIAHQWRQPLNSLSMLIQNFKFLNLAGQLTSSEIEDSVKEGIEITDYMSRTIEDFRDFFSPNKHITDFNISELLNQTISIVGMILRNKAIELEVDIRKDTEISSVKNELGQVLLNIINNAVFALDEQGVEDKLIRISAGLDRDSDLFFTITDNAGGIPEEILPDIFNARFTTKKQSEGSGVGLYMTKEIVEHLHRGQITAENVSIDYKGKNYSGACFNIKIPIGRD